MWSEQVTNSIKTSEIVGKEKNPLEKKRIKIQKSEIIIKFP